MNKKYIFGSITIIAIVGGTIYAIKKSKDMKKAEAQEITLEEAREIVKEREFERQYSEQFDDAVEKVEELDEEEMDILKDGVREMAEFNRSFMPYDDDEEDDIDETIDGPEIDDNDIGTFTEEDRVLRYEPSSMDALKQYKRMELAGLTYNAEVYDTMLRLFDFPFQPQNDGDELLRTQIIDYRVQFFGFTSKWTQQVTFADVILHYAKAAHFNCDETVEYWVEYFLEYNDFFYGYASNAIDATINTLNAHQYFNEERQTFGLFGLSRNAMDNAIKIANMNFDRSVTYEIEFQEFLKSCL